MQTVKALKASYIIELRIAQSQKARTVAESVIMPGVLEICILGRRIRLCRGYVNIEWLVKGSLNLRNLRTSGLVYRLKA